MQTHVKHYKTNTFKGPFSRPYHNTKNQLKMLQNWLVLFMKLNDYIPV